MAVGGAVLDVILAPGFLDDVARKGLLLRQALAGLLSAHPDVVAELRGEGLIQGIKLKAPPADFASAARAAKLIVIPAGDNVVRIVPPLIITDDEIKQGVDRLAEACKTIEAGQRERTQA
jgi:acetylornithine/N-succinyldiaminopimelate aminotransferase